MKVVKIYLYFAYSQGHTKLHHDRKYTCISLSKNKLDGHTCRRKFKLKRDFSHPKETFTLIPLNSQQVTSLLCMGDRMKAVLKSLDLKRRFTKGYSIKGTTGG